MITQEKLNLIDCGSLDATIINPLFEEYEINTVNRVAGFLSQCAHESLNFKVKAENLNYSAKSLRAVFGKYFKTEEEAISYARNPQKIASRVYANRMGNSDEASGEGWKFRGRGYIQLTGKNNYEGFAKHIDKDIDETIAYLETDKGALESALYYWKKANCNKYCDAEDIKGLTKSINGGYNGLADREEKFEKFKTILES